MTRLLTFCLSTCSVAIAAIAAGIANAADDNLIKVGGVRLSFNDESSDLSGPNTPPGVTVDVQNPDVVSIIYSRMIGERWSLDLSSGLPFSIEVEGDGSAAPLGKVAEADVSAVFLMGSYYFAPRDAKWRPYVSAGYNYSTVYHEETTDALNGALSGSTKARLTDAHGPAVFAGLNYSIGENWLASGMIGYQTADTEVTLITDTVVDMGAGPVNIGEIERTMEVELDPLLVYGHLGFKF